MEVQMARPFINSVKTILQQMTSIDVETEGDFQPENNDIISYGVTSIINFAGKVKGRLLLDMEPDLAVDIAGRLTNEAYSSPKEHMVLAAISEINNIIAGDANTFLNNTYGLGLRLTPPVVFTGNKAIISIPKIPSVSIACRTSSGKLKVNIAFEGGA